MDLTLRSDDKSILSQNKFLTAEIFLNPIVGDMLNSVFDIIVVLDKNRQAVYTNDALLRLLKVKSDKNVLGKRPGEILNCIHANESKDGCGTSEFCEECGALQAILEGLNGKKEVKECHITIDKKGTAMDLAIATNPLIAGSEKFVFVSIIDISDRKRREALEHIFFHDVLNIAGVVLNIADVMKNVDPKLVDEKKLPDRIYLATKRLIEEIEFQRIISYAENSELKPKSEEVDLLEVLRNVTDTMLNHSIAEGKYIKLNEDCKNLKVITDRIILQRIVGNMVKNALEASEKENTVSVGYRCDGDKVIIYVNNKSFIPLDIQHQIFQRSFSTKGMGRGLGTYSMKLLGEKYLNGKIWFESEREKGTTFYFLHPMV